MILYVISESTIAYKKIFFSWTLLELNVGGQCRITKKNAKKLWKVTKKSIKPVVLLFWKNVHDNLFIASSWI